MAEIKVVIHKIEFEYVDRFGGENRGGGGIGETGRNEIKE